MVLINISGTISFKRRKVSPRTFRSPGTTICPPLLNDVGANTSFASQSVCVSSPLARRVVNPDNVGTLKHPFISLEIVDPPIPVSTLCGLILDASTGVNNPTCFIGIPCQLLERGVPVETSHTVILPVILAVPPIGDSCQQLNAVCHCSLGKGFIETLSHARDDQKVLSMLGFCLAKKFSEVCKHLVELFFVFHQAARPSSDDCEEFLHFIHDITLPFFLD